MERIREAIARAKQGHDKLPLKMHAPAPGRAPSAPPRQSEGDRQAARTKASPTVLPVNDNTVALDRDRLAERRIFAHDGADPRCAHYDMLRTRVLQTLDEAELKTIAVTSPRAGAGKTVTSINLAFSIARQSEQSVLLVDLDLRKAPIARCLGLHAPLGMADVLAGTCAPSDAIIVPDLGQVRLSILPISLPITQPAEHIVSTAMKTLTSNLKASLDYSVIIYDLPPMLLSDDFLAFLPQVDCAMLVAAAGETTVQEIAECDRLIGNDKFLGCVLNKASDAQAGYGY